MLCGATEQRAACFAGRQTKHAGAHTRLEERGTARKRATQRAERKKSRDAMGRWDDGGSVCGRAEAAEAEQASEDADRELQDQVRVSEEQV